MLHIENPLKKHKFIEAKVHLFQLKQDRGGGMKNKKKEHIHHFVQEFAFEGTSDEKASRPKSNPFFSIDGQLGMLKKQISEMNARIEKLEKLIESKV